MSHFLCVVLVPKRTRNIPGKVSKLLAPYDENKKVKPYVYKTRDEVVAEKERITKKVNSGEPLEDNLKPFKGIERMGLKEFAQSWYSKEIDEEGNVLTTYNLPQYRIDLCPGLSYNPSNVWIIGDKNGSGQEVDCSTRNEVLSRMWTNETIRRLLNCTKELGRKVLVLPSLSEQTECSEDTGTTPKVSSEKEVRNQLPGIYGEVSKTEWTLRYLPQTTERKQMVVSGPRPQNWEDACSFMRQVQYGLGHIGGRLRITQCGEKVPHNPHILSKTMMTGGAKWDWYEIGGRWDGEIKNNVCPISELPKDFTCFAIVTPDGEWHENGKMGWWAIVINPKDEIGWELEQAALFETYKDYIAVACDLHI